MDPRWGEARGPTGSGADQGPAVGACDDRAGFFRTTRARCSAGLPLPATRLAFLAPDLQRAILKGRQPPDLTLGRLMQAPMPILWADQARLLDQLAPE